MIDVEELPYCIGTPIAHSYFQDGQYYVIWKTEGTKIHLLEGLIEYGTFLGKEYQQRPIDLYLPLLDWYCHCIPIASLYKIIRKIIADMVNISIVFFRYQDVLHSDHNNTMKNFLICADFEFLFNNIRSLFDLTQYFYKQLWQSSRDSQGKPFATTLPKSYSKMILTGSVLRTTEALINKYSIPEVIAKVYIGYGEFFRTCKDIREQVVHYGKNIETIFIKENSAFVDVTKYPFCKFDCWNNEKLDDNNLGEVLVLLRFLSQNVMRFMENFAIALNMSYSPKALIHSDWQMHTCHPLFPYLKENIQET